MSLSVDGCSDKATMKYLPDTLLVFSFAGFLILEGNCVQIYGLHLVVLSYWSETEPLLLMPVSRFYDVYLTCRNLLRNNVSPQWKIVRRWIYSLDWTWRQGVRINGRDHCIYLAFFLFDWMWMYWVIFPCCLTSCFETGVWTPTCASFTVMSAHVCEWQPGH